VLSVAAGAALLAAAVAAAAHPRSAAKPIRSATAAPRTAAAPPPVQWCGGTERATQDRVPDVVGGNLVHVIYAIASDGQDQFDVFSHRIATDISAIDAWWRRQDPTRTLRFDAAPFAGCTTGAGALDLSFVRLPHPSTTFLPLQANLGALMVDLVALGFDVRTKRYLVYYDGPTNDDDVCGIANQDFTGRNGGARFTAAVWMRACAADVGAGNELATTAAHELMHSLGALPVGAPHQCPRQDAGHPCDSSLDLMYPIVSHPFEELQLDVGRDDYYGHPGGWLDLQDSSWLMRADVPPSPLTVAVQQRAPQDRVSSEPVGIACPPACAVVFDTGARVQLTAVPARGSRFLGWTGACTATASICNVTVDAARTVGARFGPATFRLSLAVGGRGRVSVPALGVSCAARCSTSVEADTVVRVRATPARGWRFASWSGACRGRAACTVRVSAPRSVGAVFRRVR
jgi:hypothetical protein